MIIIRTFDLLNRNETNYSLFLIDEKKSAFIEPRLLSLALCCDPIGSDDTDSRGVVGVRVFTADKTDEETESEIPAETLI